MKAALFIILILIASSRVNSQFVDIDIPNRSELDSTKIIKSQFDSVFGVQVIPNDALDGEYDLLITGYTKVSENKINTNIIEISWSSIYIDGRYILVITPIQIYLRSSHDNPNPNYLYWMTSISENQFKLIKNYVETQKIKIINNYTSENSTCLSYYFDKEKTEKYKNDNWTNNRYDNFLTLMNLINQPLGKKGEKINIPNRDTFEKSNNLRLIIDFRELQDQIKMIKIE